MTVFGWFFLSTTYCGEECYLKFEGVENLCNILGKLLVLMFVNSCPKYVLYIV